eukprot:TRINITY_DN3322_c1_g2_i2.p1 TRINITY_DN3322_c1_g2~~TRINITY_DN3322_c1_g2_i2.p1  ORF type:complete len:571 (+),score=212.34 TRINITY_DN3322_c1_g2_i2:36-1748(+)
MDDPWANSADLNSWDNKKTTSSISDSIFSTYSSTVIGENDDIFNENVPKNSGGPGINMTADDIFSNTDDFYSNNDNNFGEFSGDNSNIYQDNIQNQEQFGGESLFDELNEEGNGIVNEDQSVNNDSLEDELNNDSKNIDDKDNEVLGNDEDIKEGEIDIPNDISKQIEEPVVVHNNNNNNDNEDEDEDENRFNDEEDDEDDEKSDSFNIEIRSIKIVGNGVGAYVTYEVNAMTNLDLYKNNEMNIFRRYSDFVWLQDELLNNHKGIIIPPLPDKSVIQTNKLFGNDRLSSAFTEYRKRELERFLKRISNHPTLCTSKYLQLFLETTDSAELVSIKSETKQASSSWGSFFKKIGSGSATEIDPWFTEKTNYVSDLLQKLEFVAKSATNVIQKHFELMQLQVQFSDSTKLLADTEKSSNSTLSHACTRLSEIAAQVHLLEQELGQSAAVKFSDNIKDYIRYIGNVQQTFDTRLEKLAAFQNATKDLENKKNKSSSKPNDLKLKQAVQDCSKIVEETKEVFDTISNLVRSEFERFEATKAQEMHFAIVEYAQLNMNHEIRCLDLWRGFLNEHQ